LRLNREPRGSRSRRVQGRSILSCGCQYELARRHGARQRVPALLSRRRVGGCSRGIAAPRRVPTSLSSAVPRWPEAGARSRCAVAPPAGRILVLGADPPLQPHRAGPVHPVATLEGGPTSIPSIRACQGCPPRMHIRKKRLCTYDCHFTWHTSLIAPAQEQSLASDLLLVAGSAP